MAEDQRKTEADRSWALSPIGDGSTPWLWVVHTTTVEGRRSAHRGNREPGECEVRFKSPGANVEKRAGRHRGGDGRRRPSTPGSTTSGKRSWTRGRGYRPEVRSEDARLGRGIGSLATAEREEGESARDRKRGPERGRGATSPEAGSGRPRDGEASGRGGGASAAHPGQPAPVSTPPRASDD